MKLRNKKTGEIIDIKDALHDSDDYPNHYTIREDWEDYKEPETYYYISDCVNIASLTNDHGYNLPEEIWHKAMKRRKEIGNYFETKEEAEKAVEKLKAWKRLKDKGFRSTDWKCTGSIFFTFDNYCGDGQPKSAGDDLDLLFGGEDE